MKFTYLLFLAALLSPSTYACTDVYLVEFAHKPSGSPLWVMPDERDVRLELPLQWNSSSGKINLSLNAKRTSPDEVFLEFSRVTTTEHAVFKTTVHSPINTTQPMNVIAKDSTSGDLWAVRLLPVCGSL